MDCGAQRNGVSRQRTIGATMGISASQIAALVLVWIAYGSIHTLLAALSVKRWIAARWPSVPRYYRLIYNALALVLLIPPFALAYLWRGDPLWQWSGIGFWISNALAAFALLGFLWTLRDYDTAEFIGTRQWRAHERRIEDQESLHLSALHRYVRHPWYSLGLVILWTRSMDPAMLVSALCMTAYLAVGIRYEERKLLEYHGAAYREYMRRVPALLPLPGHRLTPAEAERLAKKYRDAVDPGT